MKESQIESKVVKKAKELGFLTYKFSSPSNRGVPDRIFISPHGEVFFIEFKSAKGKLTKLQEKTIKDIIALDVRVFVIRDVIAGMEILRIKGLDA
jgi:Holliday junction resolvase